VRILLVKTPSACLPPTLKIEVTVVANVIKRCVAEEAKLRWNVTVTDAATLLKRNEVTWSGDDESTMGCTVLKSAEQWLADQVRC
jgi:hypothetical protein